jgi:hypothetical protein
MVDKMIRDPEILTFQLAMFSYLIHSEASILLPEVDPKELGFQGILIMCPCIMYLVRSSWKRTCLCTVQYSNYFAWPSVICAMKSRLHIDRYDYPNDI